MERCQRQESDRGHREQQLTVQRRRTLATLQTFFFGFFQPNFRTAVNSFQQTAFHSYLVFIHVLRFLPTNFLGCKRNLATRAGSAADSQLNAFFLSLVLALTKEKGPNLFFFFKDIHRFHKTTFACVL